MEVGDFSIDQPGDEDIGVLIQLFGNGENHMGLRMRPPGSTNGLSGDERCNTRKLLVLKEKQAVLLKLGENYFGFPHNSPRRWSRPQLKR